MKRKNTARKRIKTVLNISYIKLWLYIIYISKNIYLNSHLHLLLCTWISGVGLISQNPDRGMFSNKILLSKSVILEDSVL